MRIAFIDHVHPVLAERLQAAGHQCLSLETTLDEELISALAGAEGIIVRSRRLDASTIAAIPALRFIGRVGSGLENIDREQCAGQGVQVFNSPEGNRDGVGEMAIAHLLVLMKHVCRANAEVREGHWRREPNRGHDLAGATVGIIGYGHMGTAFAEKLTGFGVRLLAHDKYRSGFSAGHVEEASLERVQQEADVISLHLPLNNETRHYADHDFFSTLRRPVWFLNTSRGPVVDTAALLEALDNGRVRGAGLDVLEFERPDLSGLDREAGGETLDRLLRHERVLITPHVAGVTHEGKEKMAAVLADKILNAFPHGTP